MRPVISAGSHTRPPPNFSLNLTRKIMNFLQGLSYLHDSSSFRFHGNLKPTNCLIDSRWVLKLSDFGLTFGSISSKRITDPTYGIHSTPYNFHHNSYQGGTRASFTTAHGLAAHQPSNSLLHKTCQSPYLPPEYTMICSVSYASSLHNSPFHVMYNNLWERTQCELTYYYNPL